MGQIQLTDNSTPVTYLYTFKLLVLYSDVQKPFNSVQIELLALDSNALSYLTAYKQLIKTK